MGCSDFPTAVFIETNFGTRLAVPASPYITADDFKREVERMHLNCFPEFGNIRVEAVMVKQKLNCYHLPESLPLKYAFLGSDVTWFLQTRVILPNVPTHVESSKYNEDEAHNLNSAADVITDSVQLGGFTTSSSKKRTRCKRKEVKVQRFPYLKASMLKISGASFFLRRRKRKNVKKKPKSGHPRRGTIHRSPIEKEMLCRFVTGAEVNWSRESDANVIAEATGETNSEPASVSEIIKKYFTDYNEVASSPEIPFTTAQYKHGKQLNRSNDWEYLKMHSNITSPVTVHIPPHVSQMEKPSSEASGEKYKKPKVGDRLLLATNGLGLSPSNRRSILSLCRYNDGVAPFHKSAAKVWNLAFEIADKGTLSMDKHLKELLHGNHYGNSENSDLVASDAVKKRSSTHEANQVPSCIFVNGGHTLAFKGTFHWSESHYCNQLSMPAIIVPR